MSPESEADIPGNAVLPGALPAALHAELVAFRRDLHMHPELGNQEFRTTAAIKARLEKAGLTPRVLEGGTGLVCDIGDTGDRADGPILALRADIDALPIPDTKTDCAYRSTVPDRAHACGHDVHTTVVLAVAIALSTLVGLPGTVRCVFQPAEETVPGGATEVVASGVLDGASRAFAVHCDPSVPAGKIGLRTGAITAACDRIDVTLLGPGGHTARPQLTVDLVDALGRLITEIPGLLSRQVDPRAGMSLVWGAVEAGVAANAIPQRGVLRGTLRVLDRSAWEAAETLVRRLVERVVATTGASVEIDHVRGVPPVVNDAATAAFLRSAALSVVGADDVVLSPQSMGGEDFGWFADRLPIALARLGTHGGGEPLDLHRGTFDVDERAIGVGVRLMARTALLALDADRHPAHT
jgi:amidohydrolase